LKSKFQQWCAEEVTKQLQTTPLSQIKVDVTLKSLSASWIMCGWQALEKRPEVAINLEF